MSQVRDSSVLAAILASPIYGLEPKDGLDQRVEIVIKTSSSGTATASAIPPAVLLKINDHIAKGDGSWVSQLKLNSTHRLTFRPNGPAEAYVAGWPERDTDYLLKISELAALGARLTAALGSATRGLDAFELVKFDESVRLVCADLATRLLSKKGLNKESYTVLLERVMFVTVVESDHHLVPLDVLSSTTGCAYVLESEVPGINADAGPLAGAYLDHLLTKLMHERGIAMFDAAVRHAHENHGEVPHTENRRRGPI